MNSGIDEKKAEWNLEIVRKYASHELFVVTELTTFTYRLPEFRELDAMLGTSPGSFFEDTPENGVVLSEYVFKDSGFSITNLDTVPAEIKQAVLEQYSVRARTVKQYCSLVWSRHEDAVARVKEHKSQVERERLMQY